MPSLRKASDLSSTEVYVRVLFATTSANAVVVTGITLDTNGKKVREGSIDVKPLFSAGQLTTLANFMAAVKSTIETELGLSTPP